MEAEAARLLEEAQRRLDFATVALNHAGSALLQIENEILNKVRQALALEVRTLERTGEGSELIAAKIADLRSLTPHETNTRIHQRFTISSLVKSVLDDDTRPVFDIPVNILRGEGDSFNYDRRRAEILDQAEDESVAAPLEAA